MNLYFAVAGGLALILALAHSIPGELLLIRRLNKESLPPLTPFSLIEVRKWGLVGSGDAAKDTLRFSWHLPSVFAVGFGAILLWLSCSSPPRTDLAFVEHVTALVFLASSLIVLLCSKGTHLGWVLLLAIAI